MDDTFVSFFILFLEVIEQFPACRNHVQEAAARVTIFVVVFEVAGKGIDSMGKNSNLDFGATGVSFGTSIFFDELFFVFRRYRHRNPISDIALQRGKIIKLKKHSEENGERTNARMSSSEIGMPYQP